VREFGVLTLNARVRARNVAFSFGGRDAAIVHATDTAALHETPAGRRAGVLRWFFVILAVWCMALALSGFGPSFVRYLAGRSTFPPIIHFHGAIMMAWLVTYAAQAVFAARADLRMHKKVGPLAIGVAGAVWLAMVVVTVVTLKRLDPTVYQFLVPPLLVQAGAIVMFPLFVGWGYAGRRNAGWHKRMMTFATFTLVQAALDRMDLLPNQEAHGFLDSALRLYLLLILPLVAFDLATQRRLHPATVVGGFVIVSLHAIIAALVVNPGWSLVANAFWNWLR
jgi:hypothetical protein